MIILSLSSDFMMSMLSVLKGAKTTKLLKITKLNRVFKIFKTLRTIKLIGAVVKGAEMLNQVQLLLQRILLCVPIVFQLVPILEMIFYIYAILGMEIYNTKTFEHQANSPYDDYPYANFNSF